MEEKVEELTTEYGGDNPPSDVAVTEPAHGEEPETALTNVVLEEASD